MNKLEAADTEHFFSNPVQFKKCPAHPLVLILNVMYHVMSTQYNLCIGFRSSGCDAAQMGECNPFTHP